MERFPQIEVYREPAEPIPLACFSWFLVSPVYHPSNGSPHPGTPVLLSLKLHSWWCHWSATQASGLFWLISLPFLHQFGGGPLSFPPRNMFPFIVAGPTWFLSFSPFWFPFPLSLYIPTTACEYPPRWWSSMFFFLKHFLPLKKLAPLRTSLFLNLEVFPSCSPKMYPTFPSVKLTILFLTDRPFLLTAVMLACFFAFTFLLGLEPKCPYSQLVLKPSLSLDSFSFCPSPSFI